MANKQFDFIVFGATSFVGQIICQYLVENYGVGGDLKWAAAGRSQDKLDSVKLALGDKAKNLPLMVADASDATALKGLCGLTKVILSTVGPYALYGEPLIQACVETGTDYCDLTGEVQWIHQMLERYGAKAKESGARIVNCCGFDSIPSDLGVHFVQQNAQNKYDQPCQRVKLRVKAARGEFSGGTVASLLNVTKEAAGDATLRKNLANPYLLCVDTQSGSIKQPDVKAAQYDKDFNAWLAPFVMAGINTRVVHRSNALLGLKYGDDFAYDEAMLMGGGVKGWGAAQGLTLGMGGFLVASAIKPTRWLLEKYVLPAPGEGPSPEAQEKGFFDIRFYGETKGGQIVRAKVTGDRDPGYGSTAKMISESAICLAKETSSSEVSGGFWTPATAMGDRLIDRLQANAGLTFELV